MPAPYKNAVGTVLEATPTLQALKLSIRPAKRYVVAVHGIGDQFRNATIQSVVSAFAGFFNYPAGIPLGAFRKPPPAISAFNLETPDTTGALPVPESLAETTFVEIYWADIPREVQKEGYTLEETKAWARTVVARLRARYELFTTPDTAKRITSRHPTETPPPELDRKEYRAVADALEEMIETIEVLGNLLWIAEKAGWINFDLDKLLTSYVGDVQIVADFEEFRLGILKRFTTVLDAVGETVNDFLKNRSAADPEIYVVAHSEGTVVAFMGLLQAMSKREATAESDKRAAESKNLARDWYKYVRGFMTFGSPIDKHIVLWPDIWKPLHKPREDVLEFFSRKRAVKNTNIWWKNYYDYGDPVGFKLDSTRDWMLAHGWSPVFRFDEKNDDHGFARYAMPGQAHNDYWKDPSVFGHFIENVVRLRSGQPRYSEPPRTRVSAAILSYVVPYALVYLLCCLGTYFVYKATESFVRSPTPFVHSLLDVLGAGSLLTGMIAFARIFKLTRQLCWIFYGLAIFIICALPYYFARTEFQSRDIWFFQSSSLNHPAGLFAIVGGLVSAAVAGLLGRVDPRWLKQGSGASVRWLCRGAHPLVVITGLQIAAIVAYRIASNWPGLAEKGKHALWPVLLAFGAFVYLWWLAILLFDLVFVWHRYIRSSVGPKVLRAMRQARKSAG